MVPCLRQLGRAHREAGVLPGYFPLVGQALLATLERFLGDEGTPALAADWTGASALVAEVMTNAEVRGRGRQSVLLPPCGDDPEPHSELSADRVRGRLFRGPPLHRRGFDRDDVREFQRWVAEEIAVRDRETARLRAEVVRLRAKDPREHPDGALPVDDQGISLLSQAQLLAEETLTAADTRRRRLAAQAHRQAEPAAEQAGNAYRGAVGPRYTHEGEELRRRLAWARTYSHALGMPLRAAETAFQHRMRDTG